MKTKSIEEHFKTMFEDVVMNEIVSRKIFEQNYKSDPDYNEFYKCVRAEINDIEYPIEVCHEGFSDDLYFESELIQYIMRVIFSEFKSIQELIKVYEAKDIPDLVKKIIPELQ